MDSDSSPQRHRAALGDVEFRVPHVNCLPLQNQGGKTNEQERKSYSCSSGS